MTYGAHFKKPDNEIDWLDRDPEESARRRQAIRPSLEDSIWSLLSGRMKEVEHIEFIEPESEPESEPASEPASEPGEPPTA